MVEYRQAPEMKFCGKKKMENNYYEIPQDVADIIFNKLGNSSAQLRLMMVLIGTKPGFRVTEKWIEQRTGLLKTSYIRARSALVQRGWLELIPEKELIVHFDKIREEG